MKKIWISALDNPATAQPRVAAATSALRRYGLDVSGHFWNEANDKLAWRSALDGLLEAKADLWLILADEVAMARPTIRYGLSLMSAGLQNALGANFPVLLLYQGSPPAAADLPDLLHSIVAVDEASPSWPAKVVAKANMKTHKQETDYRLDILGEEGVGQWFEIGPRNTEWNGIVFGISSPEAEIDFHAVGPKGTLPKKTTLEFSQQGLTLEAGGKNFNAWAVRNRLDDSTSYFARVKGSPEAILFMPYTEDDSAEATLLSLV